MNHLYLTIRCSKFTYSNDSILIKNVKRKINKHHTLFNKIIARQWKVNPSIVIADKARTTTHISTIKLKD